MKLYNKTRCPDEILRPLLVTAGKSIGTRTGNVVVKVTQGQGLSSKGKAHEAHLVYSWHLKNLKCRRKPNNNNPGRLIQTNGGWIEITLPKLKSPEIMKCFTADAITLAERFYETAQHEWAHIKDFQEKRFMRSPRTKSGRRIKWADRPAEISAMNQVDNAKKYSSVDDMILELALYFEKRQNLK
jgi:hypothetical protein